MANAVHDAFVLGIVESERVGWCLSHYRLVNGFTWESARVALALAYSDE